MIDEAFVPDFTDFFRQDELSDVNLVIEEDHAAVCSSSMAGEKRKAPEPDEEDSSLQQTTIPGHSMVLVALSSFFKAKLKSWSDGPFPKPEIRLLVPAGQLELGELLLQAMYQSKPSLSTLSQVQLLQLLVLADRYGVSKVLIAAVAALQAVPQEELHWETVLGIYALPPGCTEFCKPLMPAVQQQLQQQLGDLELVMADSQKHQRLLALPHKVLLLLLQDKETKVASENTVFRAIESWHGYQQQHCGGCSDEELVQLLQQIRMQHCSQPFVATALAESPLAAKCFSPLELRLACICSSSGGVQPGVVMTAMNMADCPALQKFPAWKQPKRPASAMIQLSLEREVSLADLKEAVEALQKDGTATYQWYTLFESRMWQGEMIEANLQFSVAQQPAAGAADGSKATAFEAFSSSNSSSSRPFTLGLYVGPTVRGKDMLRVISFTATAVATQQPVHVANRNLYGVQAPVPQHIDLQMVRKGFNSRMWGRKDFFLSGVTDSWAALEAKLRANNLVHAGDCLQLKIEVTEVL